MELPLEPFTLVLELDAWNISERDGEQWGQSAGLRAAGKEPDRWRWIYGAPVSVGANGRRRRAGGP